jgi:hypothetical protein
MEKQFQLKGLGATDHNRIEHFIIKESEKLLMDSHWEHGNIKPLPSVEISLNHSLFYDELERAYPPVLLSSVLLVRHPGIEMEHTG